MKHNIKFKFETNGLNLKVRLLFLEDIPIFETNSARVCEFHELLLGLAMKKVEIEKYEDLKELELHSKTFFELVEKWTKDAYKVLKKELQEIKKLENNVFLY